jgi:hypothetical protein
LPIEGPYDDAMLISILKDFVSLFAIGEIATTSAFRQRCLELATLHKHSEDRVLLLQSLEEEELRPSSYNLPRISLWTGAFGEALPTHLFMLKRPLHVIIAPETTPDPWLAGRRIADTGSNVLSVDQFKLGVRH